MQREALIKFGKNLNRSKKSQLFSNFGRKIHKINNYVIKSKNLKAALQIPVISELKRKLKWQLLEDKSFNVKTIN